MSRVWWFLLGTNERAILMNAALEICSTNEGAATAIQEEAECRMDEDCDHCVLAQALIRVQAAMEGKS